MAIAIAATPICALGCAVLVIAEHRLARAAHRAEAPGRRLQRLRIGAKTVASAAFLVVGAGAVGDGGAFGAWMFGGLVFGALGDVALLGHGKRAFLAGLAAFLVGHLAYVVGIAQVAAPARWFADAGALAAAPIVVGLAALAHLWPRLGALKAPVIAYVGAIVAMVIAALAARRSLPSPERWLLAVGAVSFFASDLAVARDRFVARAFTNKLWGLPAYYAGQLLIAWAIR